MCVLRAATCYPCVGLRRTDARAAVATADVALGGAFLSTDSRNNVVLPVLIAYVLLPSHTPQMQEKSSVARSATGIVGLDVVLHGGFLASGLYLIDGNPGAGKTTLALQYLLRGIKDGERCLYVTLSETAEELRAGARSHGWSLDGIDLVELVPEESELFLSSKLQDRANLALKPTRSA